MPIPSEEFFGPRVAPEELAHLDRQSLIELIRRQDERLGNLERFILERSNEFENVLPPGQATTWRSLRTENFRADSDAFRLFVERFGMPIVVTLMDSTIVYANPAALALAGLSPNDPLPVSTRHFLSNADARDEMIQRLLAGDDPARVTVQFKAATNRTFTVRIVARPVRDAAGNIAFIVSTIHDISLLAQLEAARQADFARATQKLAQTEARYAQLYRVIPDALLVIDARTNEIIDVNPAAEAMFGVKRDRLLGTDWLDRFPHQRDTLQKLTLPDRLSNAKAVSLSGCQIAHANGTRRDIYGQVVQVTVDGKQALLVLMRDVTWRREAEASIQLLSDAMERLPDGMCIVWPDGRLRSANEALAAKYGCSRNDMIGLHVDELGLFRDASDLPFEPRPWGVSAWESETDWAIEPANEPPPEGPVRVEQMMWAWSARLKIEPLGRPAFPAHVSCSPVFDPPAPVSPAEALDSSPSHAAPSLRGIVLVIRDLSAEALFQQRLIQTEKLTSMGTLLGGLTRELNNRLAPIVGYSQLLTDQLAGSEGAYYINRILEAALSARHLVVELLSFAEAPGRVAPLDVAQVAGEVASLVEFRVNETETRLELDMQPHLFVMAHPEQLKSIFLHLIRNAIEASPRGGTVRVTARLKTDSHLDPDTIPDQTVVIAVLDDGPGIAPENLPRLFDPFFTTKPVGAGLGLGLSVCYGIVRELGGRLNAGNRSDRRGAKFTVYLPRYTDPRPSPPNTESSPGSKTPSRRQSGRQVTPLGAAAPSRPVESIPDEIRGRSVLILDDESSMVSLLTRLFETRGFVVAGYTRAAEALAISAPFDLVISDVRMPEIDGLEFRAAYRRRFPTAPSRFIFITGDTTDQQLATAITANGDMIVQKPFDIHDLLTRAIARLAAP